MSQQQHEKEGEGGKALWRSGTGAKKVGAQFTKWMNTGRANGHKSLFRTVTVLDDDEQFLYAPGAALQLDFQSPSLR